MEFDSVEYFVNSHRILDLWTCFPSGNSIVELSPLQHVHSSSARSNSLNGEVPDGIVFSWDWVSSSPLSPHSSCTTNPNRFTLSPPPLYSSLQTSSTAQHSSTSLSS